MFGTALSATPGRLGVFTYSGQFEYNFCCQHFYARRGVFIYILLENANLHALNRIKAKFLIIEHQTNP